MRLVAHSAVMAVFLGTMQAAEELEPVYFETNGSNGLPAGQAAVARWVHFKSPAPRMKFSSGLPIRVFADAIDPDAWQVNHNGWPKVEFYLDGALQGTRISDPAIGRNYFELVLNSVPVGAHTLSLKGLYYNGSSNWSQAIPIEVEPPATRATTLNLTQDFVLAGSQSQTWDDVKIVGNGFRIRSAAGWSGSLTLRNCFVTGLGNMTTTGIDLATQGSGSLTVESSVFEWTGAVNLGATGSGGIAVRNNEFRANNQITFVASNPDLSPMVRLSGNPSGPKLFQGNRVGTGWAEFQGMTGILVGGANDAEGNVFLGPRGGVYVRSCQSPVLRGNYSRHNYQGGWSQGFNFRFENSSNVLAEHNVIRGSSWPLQSFSGEFRYNLMVDSNHNWIRGLGTGTRLHHNLFVHVSIQMPYEPNEGIWVQGGQVNVEMHNNTFDGGGPMMTWEGQGMEVSGGGSVSSLRNNVYAGFVASNPAAAKTIVLAATGTLGYADYNAFANQGATNVTNYSAGAVAGRAAGAPGFGGNDLGGFGQQVDVRFAQGRVFPYPVKEGELWNRITGVSQVLSLYRARYAPGAGSPLVDAGDPADGAGTDVGAIGAGVVDPDDQFGRFGSAPGNSPPTVSITSPSTGASFPGPADLTITASAADSDGSVAKVEFFQGSTKLGEDTTAPYSFGWTGVPAGSYSLTVRATDNQGATGTSAAVPITVTVGDPRDNDGDGIPNDTDPDDDNDGDPDVTDPDLDGDGVSNADEIAAGTDPNDQASVPSGGGGGGGSDGGGCGLLGLEVLLVLAGTRLRRALLGVLSGTEVFGRREWYPEGAQALLRLQGGNGSWDNDAWNTCFAILFLKRATRPLEDVATEDRFKKR